MLFKTLLFLVSIGLIIRYWYLFPIIIIIIGILVIVFTQNGPRKKSKPIEITEKPDFPRTYESTTGRISSTVSPALYEEITQYCSRKRITVAELIRKAVKAYMDSN